MTRPEISRPEISRPGISLIVVQDQVQPCPYLDQTARMPLSLPVQRLSPSGVDQFLSLGYRRSGDYLYRTQCPRCDACKPTRVDVERFRLTKSMKRVLRRGDRELDIIVAPPTVDASRVELFNHHRADRGLADGRERVGEDAYHSFLVSSCCDVLELSIYHSGELVAVSIFDVGETSISAVYTHFDQRHHRFSLGTYAILKQFDWAGRNDRRFVYLGMYVAENKHLNYKARFLPQQRLINGVWQDFDDSESGTLYEIDVAK
jgi:arginine-tRNA-protein transferase